MAVRWGLVLCGFVLLAVVKTWPLVGHFGSRLGAQGTDAVSHLWVLAWGVHGLATQPLRLFDGNLAYPLERSFAFTDHFLGVLPLFAPAYVLTGNAVAGFNTAMLLSWALAAFGASALAWWWTRRWAPAIVAGTLFGFAPLRLSQIGHLQLLTFFWAPGALLFLDRFLRARRWCDLWAFAFCIWLQILSSFYLGMMLLVAVLVYVGYYAWAVDRTLLGRAMTTRVAAFLVASVVVLLPFHYAFLEVQRAWRVAWTPGAMVGYSADVQSYLSAPPLVNDVYVSLFRPVTPVGSHERLLFPGLILPALVLLGSFARVHGIPEREVRRARRLFGLLLVVAFVLSLGPYLVVWGFNTRVPLPYLGLYYVIPGWSAMRVPARFAFLVLLAAVPLSALGVQVLVDRVTALLPQAAPRRWAPTVVGVVLVGLFLVELGAKPHPIQAVPVGDGVPEVYRWLARERPGPIVEIPVGLADREQEYLYLSSVHWLPLVNGRTSFAPSSHDDVKAVLAELPGARGRECAAVLGLRAIVVHGDHLSREDRLRWAAAEQAGHVRRLAAFGSDVVYSVPAVARTPSPSVQIAAPDTLPAGHDARLGLRLSTERGEPWAHRAPHGIARAVVRWTELATGRVSTTTVPVTLPLAMGRDETVVAPLRVRVPTTIGRHVLDVRLAWQGGSVARVADPRTIEVRDAVTLPSSADAGAPLAVRYLVPDGTAPRTLGPGDSLHLRLVAINTGEAVWLTKPRAKKGDVALAWRWLDATDRPIPDGSGDTPIRYDVHPRQRYEFDEWPALPVDAGRYVLEVRLTAGGTGPFPGSEPVRLVVDVERPATGAARP
jgi:hypothetical protein